MRAIIREILARRMPAPREAFAASRSAVSTTRCSSPTAPWRRITSRGPNCSSGSCASSTAITVSVPPGVGPRAARRPQTGPWLSAPPFLSLPAKSLRPGSSRVTGEARNAPLQPVGLRDHQDEGASLLSLHSALPPVVGAAVRASWRGGDLPAEPVSSLETPMQGPLASGAPPATRPEISSQHLEKIESSPGNVLSADRFHRDPAPKRAEASTTGRAPRQSPPAPGAPVGVLPGNLAARA